MPEYIIRKLHNAVGWVWWCVNGGWTKDPEQIKHYSKEEAQKQYDEFSLLNEGRGLDCLAIDETSNGKLMTEQELQDFQSRVDAVGWLHLGTDEANKLLRDFAHWKAIAIRRGENLHEMDSHYLRLREALIDLVAQCAFCAKENDAYETTWTKAKKALEEH